MQKTLFPAPAERGPWLALAACAAIVILTVGTTLLWPDGGLVLAVIGPNAAAGLANTTYGSPERCRECHQDVFDVWSHTTHADASFDPIFQTYLQQVKQPGECFACHTTGYDTNTGQFVLAGVTCEACHGPYRPQHPEESMIIAASAEMCGRCHTSTLAEWQTSRHGQAGVNCIHCHEVHSQRVRAATTSNDLCAGCHQSQLHLAPHPAHHRTDVLCTDCHLARPDNIEETAAGGQAITGHSFAVLIRTCQDCHPERTSFID